MLTLKPALVAQLEQLAIEQTTTPEALLEAAVRTYLRQFERDRILRLTLV
jgi:predicted transcriptional regulator